MLLLCIGRFSWKLWVCNFYSQLAITLIIEGDYHGSLSALEQGYVCATEMFYRELLVCMS